MASSLATTTFFASTTLATTTVPDDNSTAITGNVTISGNTTTTTTALTTREVTTPSTNTTRELTTDASTSATTKSKYPSTETIGGDDDGSSSAVIGGAVGGAIGGVIIIILIVAVVIHVHRRRKKRDRPHTNPRAPGVDDLDVSNRFAGSPRDNEGGNENQTFYQNLDEQGRPNDKTDPALDEDGYMKKTKQKKQKKKKGWKPERQNSAPLHPAPPAPGNNADLYENTMNDRNTQPKPSKHNNDIISTSTPAESAGPEPMPKPHEGVKEAGYVNSMNKPKDKNKHYANLEMEIVVPEYENYNKYTDTKKEELYENTGVAM